LLDSQFMTSHLATFNAKLISKAEYMALLRKALTISARFD
jgi:Leu/Phe-tRNA-protein transferase